MLVSDPRAFFAIIGCVGAVCFVLSALVPSPGFPGDDSEPIIGAPKERRPSRLEMRPFDLLLHFGEGSAVRLGWTPRATRLSDGCRLAAATRMGRGPFRDFASSSVLNRNTRRCRIGHSGSTGERV
jgi:hypothetical protein